MVTVDAKAETTEQFQRDVKLLDGRKAQHVFHWRPQAIFVAAHEAVSTAVDEDVQVVGLSILSGAHNRLLPEVVKGLREAGLEDVLVIAGGIIPDVDATALKAAGVSEVFAPGTPIATIVAFIEANAPDPMA